MQGGTFLALESANKAVERGTLLLGFLGGVTLFLLMGLTVVAVVMRYIFNAPILGAQDLSELSLVLVVFLGLPYCGWTRGHVAVDLISTFVPAARLRFTDAVVFFTSGVLFLYVAWQTWTQGLDALEYGDASNLVEIPYFPFFCVATLGTAVYAVVLFVQAFNRVVRAPDSSER